VHDLQAEVVVLHLLDQDLLALAVERDVEEVRRAVEVRDELLFGERDRNHRFLVTVDDARDEPRIAEAFVRARTELAARLRG
jgi:hypothetical protein